MHEDPQNPHAGHRQRLYDSYVNGSLAGFSDVQTLELLLGYAYARRDTNPLAHRLLAQFGSLAAVFDAPLETLLQTDGLTRRAAILLHLQSQLHTRCALQRQAPSVILSTFDACGDYLLPRFSGAREEQVWLLCLDGKCKALDCRCVSTGSVNSACTPLRKIVELALLMNASSVVLAHNHTSGIALPSREDIETTHRLHTLLGGVDVLLADHIIVADGDYVSLRESSLF